MLLYIVKLCDYSVCNKNKIHYSKNYILSTIHFRSFFYYEDVIFHADIREFTMDTDCTFVDKCRPLGNIVTDRHETTCNCY